MSGRMSWKRMSTTNTIVLYNIHHSLPFFQSNSFHLITFMNIVFPLNYTRSMSIFSFSVCWVFQLRFFLSFCVAGYIVQLCKSTIAQLKKFSLSDSHTSGFHATHSVCMYVCMCVYWLIAFETFCVANRKRISTKSIEKVHHIPKFVFVSVRVLKSLTHLLSLCVCSRLNAM